MLKCTPFVRPPDADGAPAATQASVPAGATAASKAAKQKRKRERNPEVENESSRWHKQALATGKALGPVAHVHVADRESDDYNYLAELFGPGELFVTRVSTDRVLGADMKLYEKMDGMVVQLCRQVHLSQREPAPGAKQRKTNPPREARLAKLEVSAGTITIPRTSRAPSSTPKALELHYVLVREIDVPAGLEAVVWRLVTNLPVSTADEIARVVDIDRRRWNIEEYFKALKTGCSFNDHQLDSYDGLTKLLALLLPVAWKLLEIRTVIRIRPEAPATVVLTAQQVECLRILHDKQHPKLKLPPQPTVNEAMYALARPGGHFKQNGAPGWQILGRGLHRLLQAEEDALALLERFPDLRAKPIKR